MRSKYGNIEKRTGKHLLMKQLSNKKQYFDSGDYNMQLLKGKSTKAMNPLAIPNQGKFHFFSCKAQTKLFFLSLANKADTMS